MRPGMRHRPRCPEPSPRIGGTKKSRMVWSPQFGSWVRERYRKTYTEYDQTPTMHRPVLAPFVGTTATQQRAL